MTWLVVAVGLLLLVFVHELGHFAAAMAVGNRPRSFNIGFGPRIAGVRRNGVDYALRLIPAGGYVRLPGMHRPAARDLDAFMAPALREDPDLAAPVQRVRRALEAEDFAAARAAYVELSEALHTAAITPSARRSAGRALREIEEGTSGDAYWRQPTWKRVVVIAAGPAANIVVAFAIFAIIYSTGAPTNRQTTTVAVVEPNTPAAAAGLHVGDRLVAVDGRRAKTFDVLSARIRASHGRPVTVTVERSGKLVQLGPRRTKKMQGRWIFGFVPAQQYSSHSFVRSLDLAARECLHVATGTASAFGNIFHSKDRAQLQSTVGIVQISHQALTVGLTYYFDIVGLVSMSLALLNLLPFLPLDGGHILFSLIEGVRRRALAREVYERVSAVGFALIMLLVLIGLNNDIGRYLGG